MKRFIYLLCAAGLFAMTACDNFLDVRPESERVENDQFKDAQGFEDAIYGVYGELQDENSYGRYMYWGFTEVLASNLGCYEDEAQFAQPLSEYDYEANEVQTVIANMWSEQYAIIGYINNILAHLDERPDLTLHDYYRGEMLGLRAFLHFDLLRLFAPTDESAQGIPYVTTYSYAVKPFYTVGEVYDFILADLDEAERLLAPEESEMDYPRTNDNVRNFLNYRNTHFNLYAVWATKARVYWMRGDMANAATYAERVIASEKFPLATPQEMGDYLAGKLSEKETIFGVYSSSYIESVRTLIYNQTSFVSYHPYTEGSGASVLPFETIYTTDGDDGSSDYRYSLQYDSNTGLWSKIIDHYTLEGGSNTPSGWEERHDGFTLIHVSEMYLIAAEALLTTDYARALSYFDTELSSRGLRGFATRGLTLTGENIYNEYRKELFGEGQIWFNMKRLGRDIPSNALGRTLPASDTYYVVPIPDDEFEYRNEE